MEDHKNWKKELAEDFCEEVEGSHKYLDLAEAAYADGNRDEAAFLITMAYEEKTHAHHIRSRMKKWGTWCEEKEDMWENLVSRFHNL
jgi:rubrerythrin